MPGDDIITLPAGTYTQSLTGVEDANAGGDFDITTGITINGAGAGGAFVEGNTATTERVIHFINATTPFTATVNDVTFRNGRTASGTFGAGVRVQNGSVTFNRVTVRDNISLGRGGGIYVLNASSVLTMNDSVVTNNQTSTSGVATASAGGAGLYQNGGTVTLSNTSVTNNTSAVTGSTAATPPNPVGGGILVFTGTMNLNSSIVSVNTATSAQSASFGGGIVTVSATAAVNLTNSVVSNNTAAVTNAAFSAIVGGIDIEGGTLTMTESTVSGNTGGNIGGIRVLSATANINRSAITGNIASLAFPGGIYAITGTGTTTVNLNNSTVSGNTTPTNGGGVGAAATNTGNAVVNINFSTIAGNTADVDGTGGTEGGGGVANYGQSTTGQTGTSTINLQKIRR